MKKNLVYNAMLLLLGLYVHQNVFSQSVDRFIDHTIKVDTLNVPMDAKQSYFPKELIKPEVKDGTQKKDSLVIFDFNHRFELPVNWYSKTLFEMKEPLLFNRKTIKEIYRFTWLRAFHAPMSFRFEKWKDRYVLYWKVLGNAPAYEQRKLVINSLKVVSKKEWQTFIALVEKSKFWNMELGSTLSGNDGAEWIMEGNDTKNYRVVREWSPSKGGFYDACNYLISLSGMKIRKGEKY
ncbi:hypothetical protein [Spongiimicrobium salis]|uniref:hypothetical protein n=1 Tax=Spongiimicrobium salis TaxID=1667022 RepID=UPI00374DB5E3